MIPPPPMEGETPSSRGGGHWNPGCPFEGDAFPRNGPSRRRPPPSRGRGLRAPSTRARSSGRRPLLPRRISMSGGRAASTVGWLHGFRSKTWLRLSAMPITVRRISCFAATTVAVKPGRPCSIWLRPTAVGATRWPNSGGSWGRCPWRLSAMPEPRWQD